MLLFSLNVLLFDENEKKPFRGLVKTARRVHPPIIAFSNSHILISPNLHIPKSRHYQIFLLSHQFIHQINVLLQAILQNTFPMGDYIYILIGIVWVAYTLYSARQKALQKQQDTGLPPSGPSQSSPLPIPGNQGGGKSLLEDIFRELTGETKPVPRPSQPFPTTPTVQPAQVRQTAQAAKSSTRYADISGFAAAFPQNEQKGERISGANDGQTMKNDSIAKRFDLREAVIFSELLNRKYF